MIKERQKQPKEREAKIKTVPSGKLAVILVRGTVNVTQAVKDTLTPFHLSRKNHCVIVESTPAVLGRLDKVKDFVTWGEIDEPTFKELVEKRGKEYKSRVKDSKGKYTYQKFFDFNGKIYKKYFRLNPPRKGFGRKGIKVSFRAGGALGYRGEKINDLIGRML